jgi:hypothetical protein
MVVEVGQKVLYKFILGRSKNVNRYMERNYLQLLLWKF